MPQHTNANPIYVDTSYTHHGDAPRTARNWADYWQARADHAVSEDMRRHAQKSADTWRIAAQRDALTGR